MRKFALFLALLVICRSSFALLVPSGGNFSGNVGGSVFIQGQGGTPTLGVRNDGASVVLAPVNQGYGPIAIDQYGRLQLGSSSTFAAPVTAVGHVRTTYSTVPVSTTSYTPLTTLVAAASFVEVFDSSGETLVFATGAPGVEVDQFYIFPGGNDARISLNMPVGTQISIKAVSRTATVGENTVNFYQ